MSLAQVKEFHEAFGHPVSDQQTLIPEDRFKLRMALIREELEETVRDFGNGDLVKTADGLADLDVVTNGALLEFGFTEYLSGSSEYWEVSDKNPPSLQGSEMVIWAAHTLIYDQVSDCLDHYYLGNVEDIIEALFTIKNIVANAARVLNIPLKDVCDVVHKANMSKLGADGKPIYRESDNKILKGPNFRPPEEDIENILKEHGAKL